MKRRDFCKGLAVTLAAGALAPGAALPQAGAATALVGRAVPDDYYTLWYRSDRCSADLRHDYYYSDSLFDHAATEYDDKLALATLGMAAAADSSWESDRYYWMTGEVGRAAHIRDAFAKLGFAEVQLFNYTHSLNDAPDTAACAVARKTLVRGGRQVTIIGAFVRGSGYGAEWSGNLHAGSGSAHTGFVAAARQLTEKIRGYVQASAKRQPLGTLKLWMGGYSRAGGVTNLLAARLPAVLPQLEKKNTFVYTFAAPAALAAADCPELQQDFDNNHTASGSLKKNWGTSNIFNIISSGDVVPRVLPAEWGFYRNGNDRFLPATVVPEELQALNDRSAGMEGAPLDFGRLAVTDASELPPTYGVPFDRVIGLIAGGDGALRRAVEHAEDDMEGAWRDMAPYAPTGKDVLIGIAASGTTPYVIGGLRTARKHGLLTGSITCNPASPVAAEAEYALEAVVGPEFVTGSTRMKAGTAQKLMLNMLSTAVMIRLGRVEGNRMVNMQLTNDKLVARGTRMVAEASGLDQTRARELLLRYGSVKKALEHVPESE